MLQELGVVHGAVMVDYVRRPLVFAEKDVRRISDRRTIEAVRQNLGSTHYGM
jgi:hypothetical protein